mmetsp:Transcript_20811/g.34815  ORF Transcript_20811/g.34815 Transcript_20811/m.34815 type:complete len:369 (-) Transcript_20811:240-1346(-)
MSETTSEPKIPFSEGAFAKHEGRTTWSTGQTRSANSFGKNSDREPISPTNIPEGASDYIIASPKRTTASTIAAPAPALTTDEQDRPTSTGGADDNASDTEAGGSLRTPDVARTSTTPTTPDTVKRVRTPGASDAGLSPRAKLRLAAATFANKPAIYCRPKVHDRPETSKSGCTISSEDGDGQDADDDEEDMHMYSVPCWPGDPMAQKLQASSARSRDDSRYRQKMTENGMRQSVHKVARQKGVSTGKTYTSKYRGVHQTFPTRRWEAQFRRAGKPTSLGCFDREEEAARAYDKMMVWVELHSADMRQTGTLKGGTTNFDVREYMNDISDLQVITQDDLVQALRREGRSQAAANTAAALKARPRISVCT